MKSRGPKGPVCLDYMKNNQSAVNFDDQVFNLFNHRAPSTTKKCLQTPTIMEFHL